MTKIKLKRITNKGVKAYHTRNYEFAAYNKFFVARDVPDIYLRKIIIEKSIIFSGAYQTFFDTLPLLKSLSLHSIKINRIQNKADTQSSFLIACMQVSDYKIAFTTIYCF